MRDEDLSEVVVIEALSFNAPKSEDVFRHDEKKYLVAKEKDQAQDQEGKEKVVGYVGIEEIAGEKHIINMAVHPNYRNQGIGKQLLARVLKDDEVAYLEVRVSNLAAQKIYDHFGFKNVGLRRKYYQDNDEDAYIMRREPNKVKHNV